ncbi:calmodulin [Trypanosoma rangeli]|uniref:Calmodulin n=1 Tax=Trypanosoma rangeli TaxID=5698 RepID=A0A422NPY0_TRYRA|nr:calmodulin [Trypanosoma rangeli]RNF07449.1 calmodulin [Trypanosoma rangeli]|eukprot:RNF07449.1 calmodulin [Trypanosoma rangeli]
MDERTRRPPSVLTSEVYNEAETTFAMLENKEKLVSFLDCMTLLRAMGMNPTQADMDYLRERMADPILRLEQWRREEELKREKERRREEMRDKRRSSTAYPQKKPRKSAVERALLAGAAEGQVSQQNVKIIPVEEIKNIDWNIFISCAEEIYRDAAAEQRDVLGALKLVDKEGTGEMTIDKLVRIVTTSGENVLNPGEAQQLRTLLPQKCSLLELAARLQGTYIPPTKDELVRASMEELERRRQHEASEKPPSDDGLSLL